MRTVVKGQSVVWASGGIGQFQLTALPAGSQGNMVPYLTRFELVCSLSVTVGAGGQSVNALQWANYLAKLTMTVDGGPWGPNNISGEHLRIHDFAQGGEPIPYGSNTAGDTLAANSAGAITRVVRHVYDFEKLGPITDPWAFCPPCAALRTGTLDAVFGTTPTNVTNTATSFQSYFHIVWRSEAQSVARVRTQVQAFGGTGQSILQSGLLIRLIAHQTTQDFAAADVNVLQVYKDGVQLLNILEILDQRAPDYNQLAKTTTSQVQETFMDPLGGNFVRGVNIYPLRGARSPLGDLPVGDNFKYDFGGGGTVANQEWLYTVAEKQTPGHITKTLGGCGCDIASLVPGTGKGGARVPSTSVLVPKGPNSGVLNSSRLNGYTPFTMVGRNTATAKVAANLGVV